MYSIGIDLGGTKIAAGVTDQKNQLLFETSIPTNLPKTAEAIADSIYILVSEMLAAHDMDFAQIESVGVGIPGTVNQETGMVEYANNFGFDNVPFVKMIEERFPCPVYAENDAGAAAWGEYIAGAGRGCRSMVAVTLGTGVGGGIILDGKLLGGCNRAAGEVGHMVIERGGRPCTCGRKGCLEAYASATAFVKRAREEAEKAPDSLLNSLCGHDINKLNGKLVFDAVLQNDPTAKDVLEEYLNYLSEGIANLINILQPEILCIGGGLSGAGEQLIIPIREKTAPLLYSRYSRKNTKIVQASLGNTAGIIGAAGLHLMNKK